MKTFDNSTMKKFYMSLAAINNVASGIAKEQRRIGAIGDSQLLAIAALRALFIPVTEDLPDDEETVWIWRGTDEPEKGYRSAGDWLSMETGIPVIVHDVTHWMAMLKPELKEKGE